MRITKNVSLLITKAPTLRDVTAPCAGVQVEILRGRVTPGGAVLHVAMTGDRSRIARALEDYAQRGVLVSDGPGAGSLFRGLCRLIRETASDGEPAS